MNGRNAQALSFLTEHMYTIPKIQGHRHAISQLQRRRRASHSSTTPKPIRAPPVFSITAARRSQAGQKIKMRHKEIYQRHPDMRCTAHLILEASVLVLPEQRRPHAGQRIDLQQLQPLLEGVVDIDLASAVVDDDSTGPAALRLAQLPP